MEQIRVEKLPEDEELVRLLSQTFWYCKVRVRKYRTPTEREYPQRVRELLLPDQSLYVKWRVSVDHKVFYVERRTDFFEHCCEHDVGNGLNLHHSEEDRCCFYDDGTPNYVSKNGVTRMRPDCKCMFKACRIYLSFKHGRMNRSIFNMAIDIFDDYDIENETVDKHDTTYYDVYGDTLCGNHHYFYEVLDEQCACTRREDGIEEPEEKIPLTKGSLTHSRRCHCSLCLM
jgi:hypothetical protein